MADRFDTSGDGDERGGKEIQGPPLMVGPLARSILARYNRMLHRQMGGVIRERRSECEKSWEKNEGDTGFLIGFCNWRETFK